MSASIANPGYSDYIVYADESGDHSLTSIDPGFPVFALTLCVFRKVDYYATVVPAFERFKFDFWGHDSIIMHEADIRKQAGPFAILRTDPNLRRSFFAELNDLIDANRFAIIASVIHKELHARQYKTPRNPYEIALLFCMERLLSFLLAHGQEGRRVHVIFESRGRNEDSDLELEFRRIVSNTARMQRRRYDFTRVAFEPLFAPKTANSSGLQLADLTARPIALSVLRPTQANRAFDLIEGKITDCKVFP